MIERRFMEDVEVVDVDFIFQEILLDQQPQQEARREGACKLGDKQVQ